MSITVKQQFRHVCEIFIHLPAQFVLQAQDLSLSEEKKMHEMKTNKTNPSLIKWKCSGLVMLSTLASVESGLGLKPGLGHCVVFLGKTGYFTFTVHLSIH